MAAPSKFTPDVVRAFCFAKESGASHADAARSAGISLRLVYVWIARGMAGEDPYAEFTRALTRAEVARRDRTLREIRECMA